MVTRRIGARALLGSALLIVLAFAGAFWLMAAEQQRLYNQELGRRLQMEARLLVDAAREGWSAGELATVARQAQTLSSSGTVVIVARSDGQALVDMTGGSKLASQLLERPEVQDALQTGSGNGIDRLFGDSTEYVVAAAVVAGDEQSAEGIVWLAQPAWSLASAWRSLGHASAQAAGIALVAILGLAYLMSYLRARLVQRLTRTARDLSSGDLSAQADVAESREFAELSAALNQTRQRLAKQVATIDRQRLALELLVEQLAEGVIVARPDGHIALINPAAIRLLNLPAADREGGQMVGMPLERRIPQHDLQRMLRGDAAEEAEDAIRDAKPSAAGTAGARPEQEEARIQVESARGTVHLLARASSVLLPDAELGAGRLPGRMLVLTDITELTRTLRIKTDFAANASHELRTPLSAIRAAVETLLQMDVAKDAAAARRFLQTIDRQSGRLQALVSDLLDLSRLEAPTARFEPQPLEVREVLGDVEARFAEQMQAKNLAWQASCAAGADRAVHVHPHLLRLILDNLVDNAVKFTEAGGSVRVSFGSEGDWNWFEVADSGCGIPEPEQQRVFERFHQVERARSGEDRGTGLGLSIVRHAALAMGGKVSLESTPGKGTRVTVKLPRLQTERIKQSVRDSDS